MSLLREAFDKFGGTYKEHIVRGFDVRWSWIAVASRLDARGIVMNGRWGCV
jgi:hypothetical protein